MVEHANLTGASLHPPGYVQAADPGAVGADILWVEDDKGDRNFQARVRNAGDAAWADMVPPFIVTWTGVTTDAVPTEIFMDGAAIRLPVQSDSTIMFHLFGCARRTDVDNESAGYEARGVIDNNAGTTALVGVVNYSYTNEDTAAWAWAATADNVNDALAITVTGEVAKTISWKFIGMIVEVVG